VVDGGNFVGGEGAVVNRRFIHQASEAARLIAWCRAAANIQVIGCQWCETTEVFLADDLTVAIDDCQARCLVISQCDMLEDVGGDNTGGRSQLMPVIEENMILRLDS